MATGDAAPETAPAAFTAAAAANSSTGGASSSSIAAKSIDGLVTSDALRKICADPTSSRRLLVDALERHYAEEFRRIPPMWIVESDGSVLQPTMDVAKLVGVPGAVLTAVLAGKCRDQRIPVTAERQKRFAQWMQSNCGAQSFTLSDAGVGPECAKGVVLVLALNDRFTSLNLASNSLGNRGAAVIATVLSEHQTLQHMDLAANDIGPLGANALFEALEVNRSVTHLDLSSRPGCHRNRLARYCAGSLERLLAGNTLLEKLLLTGTTLGMDGVAGLAMGLARNNVLLHLDLANNDLGPKGVALVGEALVNSGVEELNLSENRAGDEGLSAFATFVGALPSAAAIMESSSAGGASGSGGAERAAAQDSMAAWLSCTEGAVKASSRHFEAMASLWRAVAEVQVPALWRSATEGPPTATSGAELMLRATVSSTQLASAVEAAVVPMPRLKVLNLSSNSAGNVGISRVEDALQANRCLERLQLDGNDHNPELGARALVTALPINATLRTLSLCQGGLGTTGVVNLAKALILNQGLENLSLRGNPLSQESAYAIGMLLACGAKPLRQLNLSSCHLEDASGVHIGNGLALNTSLQALLLRDNLLREGAGKALSEALRRHTALLQLPLELNSVDFRFLANIKKLLDRNTRLREKQRPAQYRARIDELKECQREVAILEQTLEQNEVLKLQKRLKQAAALQGLKDAREEERRKQAELAAQLDAVQKELQGVREDIGAVQGEMQGVVTEGEYAEGHLRLEIASMEERIEHHRKHANNTRQQLEAFNKMAKEEMAEAQGELERAVKERNIAAASSDAVHRHIDSYASALRSIESDIAGGANPRQNPVALPTSRQAPGRRSVAAPKAAATGRKRPASARKRPAGSEPPAALVA